MNKLNYYLETVALLEALKKIDPSVLDNFIITDSGDNSEQRYRVWSFAEKRPKVIAIGGPSELNRLMERFYVTKKDIFDEKTMLRFIA